MVNPPRQKKSPLSPDTHTLSLGPIIYGMSVQAPSVQLKLSAGFVQPPVHHFSHGAAEAVRGRLYSRFPSDPLSEGQESLCLREIPLDLSCQRYYYPPTSICRVWGEIGNQADALFSIIHLNQSLTVNINSPHIHIRSHNYSMVQYEGQTAIYSCIQTLTYGAAHIIERM